MYGLWLRTLLSLQPHYWRLYYLALCKSRVLNLRDCIRVGEGNGKDTARSGYRHKWQENASRRVVFVKLLAEWHQPSRGHIPLAERLHARISDAVYHLYPHHQRSIVWSGLRMQHGGNLNRFIVTHAVGQVIEDSVWT